MIGENKKFTYWIILLPIIAIILTSTILSFEFISYEKKEFEEQSKELEEQYILELKQRIKNRINRVNELVRTDIQLTYEDERSAIKSFTQIGFNTIKTTYENNIKLSKYEILEKIKIQLRNLHFFENRSGYFFIIDINDKTIMNSQSPENEDLFLSELKDSKGKLIIKEFKNIALSKGEGFSTWYWTKPNQEGEFEKLGFIKYFKPLEIYIGTAKYSDDIQKKIKKRTQRILDSIKYNKDEYVFALNKEGTTVSHINKSFIGKKIDTLTDVEQKIITNILEVGKDTEGGFIEYTPTSHNLEDIVSKKISYVKTFPEVNWVVGTGQYTTKIIEQINKSKEALKEELVEATKTIILISIFISIILIIALAYLSLNLQRRFQDYENELKQKNRTLEELNLNLENKVREQVDNIRKKDDILNQQSKLASMGEMIGNIAHQWRQPLSTISTAASGIKMHDEMGILKKDMMYHALDTIIHNTKLLSQTIDDFRNFFKKNKKLNDFDIEKTFKKVLTLISASLKNNDIHVIIKTKPFELYGLENELIQALLNILTNSKDALLESKSSEKFIFVDIETLENRLVIKVRDNAGGIPLDIIDKVFEPYFTTKFKSQGTGIGLYMTRTIIVNHMGGEISVENVNFTYDSKEYKGAEFKIILDKK